MGNDIKYTSKLIGTNLIKLILYIPLFILIVFLCKNIGGHYLENRIIRNVASGIERKNNIQNNDIYRDFQADLCLDSINPLDRKVDFDALQEINQDIIGWIYIPHTEVDYPILQAKAGKDADYYLNRDMFLRDSKYGCIYIQPNSSESLKDKLTVIFGHNMRDNSMFGSIAKYKSHEYFNNHDKIYIYTPYETKVYTALAFLSRDNEPLQNEVDVLNEDFNRRFMNYISNNSVVFNENAEGESFIALQTCSSRDGKNIKDILVGIN